LVAAADSGRVRIAVVPARLAKFPWHEQRSRFVGHEAFECPRDVNLATPEPKLPVAVRMV